MIILGLNLLLQELISSSDTEVHIRKIFKIIVNFIVFSILSVRIWIILFAGRPGWGIS